MSQLAAVIRATQVESGKAAIFWLGGATFAFKTASGKVVYVDPYLSDSLDHFYSWKRLPGSPIPIQPHEVEADLILVTHAHEDHLDPETLPELARSSRALFAGPASCVQAMLGWGFDPQRVVQLDCGDQREAGQDFFERLIKVVDGLPPGEIQAACRESLQRRRSGLPVDRSCQALSGLHPILNELIFTFRFLPWHSNRLMEMHDHPLIRSLL